MDFLCFRNLRTVFGPVDQDAHVLGGDVSERLARLEGEVRLLREIICSHRHIDLVDFGELRTFLYTDDIAYRQLAAEYKHFKPGPSSRDLFSPARSASSRYDNPDEPLLSLLLSHYWVNSLDFTYLDIGCQYGTSAMATAQIIRSSGNANRVIAFDPGVAGALVPYNLALNGMEPYVTYERLAVAEASYPTIVLTESGHSENNRIVNCILQMESMSYPAWTTSVDEYLRGRDIAGNVVAKIDTQGGEVEVFAGMRDTVRDRLVCCLTEFVPDALAPRVNVQEWLAGLGHEFVIFDLQGLNVHLDLRHRLPAVDSQRAADFIEDVARRNPPYTDLLLLSRRLPKLEALTARLCLAA